MYRAPLIVLLFLSLLLGACSPPGSGTTPAADTAPPLISDTAIIAEGRLEPIHHAEVAFTTSGRISQVLVEEGQEVEKGQELIRLGDASDLGYAAAQLELVSAQKALNDLVYASGADLAQAVIDLKEAQEQFDKAEDYLTYLQNEDKVPQTETRSFLVQTRRGYEYRTRTKHFKGPAPQDWIIEAENDLALKKVELDAAQRTYERLKDGADAEELVVLQARLEAAQAGLSAFSVITPFEGVVADLNATLGESIQAGEPAVTIADFSQWLVKTTDLSEIDVVAIYEGQPVTVTLDAIPDAALTGEVLSIGQTFSENQGDIVYEVTILLTETVPAMRWGMTAAVNFED